MKKILGLVLILLFFSTSISLAQQFCEEPFGAKFFTERNLAEAIVSKDLGPAFKKDQQITAWRKQTIFSTLFFKSNKLVAASTMIIVPLNSENIGMMMELFQDSAQVLSKGNIFKQEKEVNDKFETMTIKGIKYNCGQNSIEHAVLYLSKDVTNGLLTMNLYIYLSGFGLKEY